MNDTTRKQRTVMMTDAEWQDLKESSAVVGMRPSAFIVHRLATTSASSDDARIGDNLARMERSLAVLEEVERLRLAGDPDTWKAINERVDARLALERSLGR